jgi:Peptidase family S41
MKKAGFSLIILMLLCSSALSQQSAYVNNFDWMVKTFEDNDAGFEYYLKQKGSEDYSRHVTTYREKILQVKSEQDFLTIMNEWLFYFRKGHIGFYPTVNNNNSLSEVSNDSIRALYKNEGIIDLNKSEFERYLQENKTKIHPIEGIWGDDEYSIGIIQSKESLNKFDAFIIKADSVYWLPKQIKAELTLLSDSTFDVNYFMRDHSIKNISAKFDGNSHKFLSMYSPWIKNLPYAPFSHKDSIYLKFATSKKPYLRKLSPKTIYLRIPSFITSEKEAIDRLLSQNEKLIKSTNNLIIDIRNGTGGGDGSWFGLIPYLYTTPIRHPGLRYRATELNARCFEKFGNKVIAQKLRENLGKYYELDNNAFLINSFVPSLFPKRVAVICNKKNASADEAFLFSARQSNKVKIFGRPTAGMLDFSNVNSVNSLDGKYVLDLTITERKEFADYRVDDIGIQPDIFIDNSIKEEDWVDFVQSIIEKE